MKVQQSFEVAGIVGYPAFTALVQEQTIPDLVGLSLQLRTLHQQLLSRSDVELLASIETLREQAEAIIHWLGDLIEQLEPVGLIELGLTAALEGYVARLQRQHPELPLVELDLDESGTALPEGVARIVFRAAQILLDHTLQHAQANHFVLTLRLTSAQALLRVWGENGLVEAKEEQGKVLLRDNIRLVALAEQVRGIKGTLYVGAQSSKELEVRVAIPLHKIVR